MKKRKICVITGSRAEYGLLYWLMKEIQADNDLELQIAATGMHLSPEFGYTFRVIEQDGFVINEKVEMLLSSDTPVGVTKSLGLGTIGFADVFERLKPDVIVVLGDRFEILAAAQAALVARIPLAHIHGGEVTEGAVDESIRHAVTKMSHLHFVASETYRTRVIQLGESPETVYNCGAPGLDNIARLKLLDRKELEQVLGFELGKLNFLVTYHPVTLSSVGPKPTMEAMLKALDFFPDAKLIFTRPNCDMDGRIISQMIDEYARSCPERVFVATSLGQLKYLSAMLHSDVVIGNSSSGIIEAPFLGKPTVNIGDRQQGRMKVPSVLDCAEHTNDIVAAIEKALSPGHQKAVKEMASSYGVGNACVKIKDLLKTVKLDGILIKKFHDLKL